MKKAARKARAKARREARAATPPPAVAAALERLDAKQATPAEQLTTADVRPPQPATINPYVWANVNPDAPMRVTDTLVHGPTGRVVCTIGEIPGQARIARLRERQRERRYGRSGR